LADFFKHQDTELLLGRHLADSVCNDTSAGRAMDAIFEVGAKKFFGGVACQACRRFPLDMGKVHLDTTSVDIWGNYDRCSADSDKINITYGHGKDHRPDLKQFLVKMLCVGRNIPVLKGCIDGNAGDKTVNNDLLSRISKHMARHEPAPGAFLYIADAATVTEDNLGAYREQYTIGRNFSFPKDPLTVNGMFLKKPERIELLGPILRMALLVWNLIEHLLRQHVLENNVGLPNWDNKKDKVFWRTPPEKIRVEHGEAANRGIVWRAAGQKFTAQLGAGRNSRQSPVSRSSADRWR
jgi:transposase